MNNQTSAWMKNGEKGHHYADGSFFSTRGLRGARSCLDSRWASLAFREAASLARAVAASSAFGNGVVLSTFTLSVVVMPECKRNSTSWSPKVRIECGR